MKNGWRSKNALQAVMKRTFTHPFLPKLDGDWANIDGLLFNPPDPIKIDDGCCCWIADGGRISKADELVGTTLT